MTTIVGRAIPITKNRIKLVYFDGIDLPRRTSAFYPQTVPVLPAGTSGGPDRAFAIDSQYTLKFKS
jgi:hypothetical protein